MTSTMLGELSRLFQAESKKASSPSSTIRLNAIAHELRERQRHTTSGPVPTIFDPLNLGGKLQDLAAQNAPTTSAADPAAALQGALSNIANQVKEQGTQASGSAQQAGTQAQTAAQSVNTMLLAVAVGIGLVIILTRK